MVRTTPFTDHLEFSGHPGYFNGLPQGKTFIPGPSVRAGALPPVVAPARGLWSWTKTATSPAATPNWGVRGQTGNTIGR